MMASRAIKFSGKHWHYLFCLHNGRILSPIQLSGQRILKIVESSKTHNFIKSIDILFCDEIGQVSAEFLFSIDIVLRRVSNNNIFFGGSLTIGTIDHTQIQLSEGRPFLTSSHMIPCFRMVESKQSARANSDPSW